MKQSVAFSFKISPKFVSKGPIQAESSLIQMMIWGLTDDKSLRELIKV